MPADGYNLVATTSTTVTLDPQMTPGVRPCGFHLHRRDGEFPEAFIAKPESGWKTVTDAFNAIKAPAASRPIRRPPRSTAW